MVDEWKTAFLGQSKIENWTRFGGVQNAPTGESIRNSNPNKTSSRGIGAPATGPQKLSWSQKCNFFGHIIARSKITFTQILGHVSESWGHALHDGDKKCTLEPIFDRDMAD